MNDVQRLVGTDDGCIRNSGPGVQESARRLRSEFTSSLKAQSLPFEFMISNGRFTMYVQGSIIIHHMHSQRLKAASSCHYIQTVRERSMDGNAIWL